MKLLKRKKKKVTTNSIFHIILKPRRFSSGVFFIVLHMAFILNILGSSAAVPTEERALSAQVLEHEQINYLIDCGEGTQYHLKSYHVKMSRIDHVFISHLHGDHYYGLIGLMFSMHLMGRTKDLHIYAHESLQEILDIQIRVSGSMLAYKYILHPLCYDAPQIIMDTPKLTVESIPLEHRIPTCGFVFREKQLARNISKEFVGRHPELSIPEIKAIKAGSDYIAPDGRVFYNEEISSPPPEPTSYAYISDTRVFKALPAYLGVVRSLYHEATFGDGFEALAREKFHSTSRQAAQIAQNCQCEQLLIGHISARYKHDAAPLLAQAREEFPNTILVEDGQRIVL